MLSIARQWALVTTLGLALAGCANPASPSDPDRPPLDPNTLSEAERAAGWRLLFDGRTTSGWRGFRQASIPTGWVASDGALTRTSGGGDIITIDEFTSFELALEWQIAAGGNSGILFRVTEDADATFHSGPEMQVLDNAGHPDGSNPLTSAGSCYGLYAPASSAAAPAGAWNAVRLIVNGSHVEHWMNGVKIVEYELGSADWIARWQASPLRDLPRYGREPRGHIALQDHGDRVAYRGIKIREL
jgi:hypothetical protein